MEISDVSFSKIPCSITVRESDSTIDVILKLPAKACVPIDVTEFGITSDVKLSQAQKALITMVLTVFGI